MKTYNIPLVAELDEDSLKHILDGTIVDLPPFSVDFDNVFITVFNLAIAGKLGKKIQNIAMVEKAKII